MLSAEQGDIVGMHWIGVFYHDGFGVSKDTGKAKGFLEKAAALGNCQSMYQLYMICSGNEGEEDDFKDVPAAYDWLFKEKKLDTGADDETKKDDILSMYQAGITEM